MFITTTTLHTPHSTTTSTYHHYHNHNHRSWRTAAAAARNLNLHTTPVQHPPQQVPSFPCGTLPTVMYPPCISRIVPAQQHLHLHLHLHRHHHHTTDEMALYGEKLTYRAGHQDTRRQETGDKRQETGKGQALRPAGLSLPPSLPAPLASQYHCYILDFRRNIQNSTKKYHEICSKR